MDFFEWTKIVVAVVLSVLIALTAKVIGDVEFHQPTEPELAHNPVEGSGEPVNLAEVQRDYPTGGDGTNRSRLRNYIRDIENAEVKAPESSGGPTTPVQTKPLPVLLAEANADTGKRYVGVCTACHTFDEGGRNNVGPNLWNIVGRDIAKIDGFGYSDAMQAEEGTWSYEKLDAFLARPATAIPGTSMAFAGVRRASERAHIIMYLRSLSASPLALPDIPPPAEEVTDVPADPVEEPTG